MARRTITVLTDDLDGRELKDGQGQTVPFSVGGTQYEIDLSDKNLGKFYDALKPYTEVARRVGGPRTTGPRRPSPDQSRPAESAAAVDNKAVRAWAASNGVEVSTRGRIPAEVVEQYRAAGN